METERIALSQRERDRLKVLHEVQQKHLTQLAGAARLKLSDRQVRRMLLRLRQRGGAPTYLLLELIFMVRWGSKNHDLFVTQGHQRIYVRRAVGWDETGCETDQAKQQRDDHECGRIRRADSEQ